jgi:hypothetical protein
MKPHNSIDQSIYLLRPFFSSGNLIAAWLQNSFWFNDLLPKRKDVKIIYKVKNKLKLLLQIIS